MEAVPTNKKGKWIMGVRVCRLRTVRRVLATRSVGVFLALVLLALTASNGVAQSTKQVEPIDDREAILMAIGSKDHVAARRAFERTVEAKDCIVLRELVYRRYPRFTFETIESLVQLQDRCAIPYLIRRIQYNLPTVSGSIETAQFHPKLDEKLLDALAILTGEQPMLKTISNDEERRLVFDQYVLWWEAHREYQDCPPLPDGMLDWIMK